MNDKNREMALLDVIRQGLVLSAERLTQQTLGERTGYIGLTDLARYRERPRAAVAQKIFQEENSLPRLLTLQRGHWFEEGIANALKCLGLSSIQQLEISIKSGAAPLNAHLDFTLVWSKPANAVRILEIKSTDTMPDMAREAHMFQAQAQVWLLHKYWNEPVFNLRGKHGQMLCENLTFPQICKKRLGVSLSNKPDNISVESWLLYLSMSHAKCFGPYVKSDDFAAEAMRLGNEFWTVKNACLGDTPDLARLTYAQGYYPLCQSCGFSADCPKFKDGGNQPQWEGAIAELDAFKAEKTNLETKIREMEEALKNAHRLSGTSDWINTGSHRFRLAPVKGRKCLDRGLLREQLADLFEGMGIENMNVDEFLASCEKEGAPGTRLYINPVK